MKLTDALLVLLLLFFVSCDNQQSEKPVTKDTTEMTETTAEAEVSDNELVDKNGKVYPLKEDGLYAYIDGPDTKKSIGNKCFESGQKNYKYLRLPSKTSKIQFEEKETKRQTCNVSRSCDDNLGKPSLFQLGYDRHKEREIKPEDNRFGRNLTKTKNWIEKESRLFEKLEYKFIDKSEFMQFTVKEFETNGIVIVGKRISRVVIKSIAHLPKWGNKIVVAYDKIRFDCKGAETSRYSLLPKVIADFKRIHFKENIFEFIKEEPLPGDANYISDMDFINLSESIHQLIPRIRDRTIHKYHKYRQGYYLVEYYTGDELIEYHCIKLGSPGRQPSLFPPLSIESPKHSESNVLVFGVFEEMYKAEELVKSKDPYPLMIYVGTASSKYYVGRKYTNMESLNKEMNRLIRDGVDKKSLKVISTG
ncbi:MAG: hypothetical protein KAH48_11155 [Chlorobi bacterium]|nr:hypothetical protein [Chlorobiota bacterium]